MEIAAKAVVIALCGALMTLLIKRTNPEISLLLSMAVSAVITVMALRVYEETKDVLELAKMNMTFSKSYTEPVFKCVGIGITARIGSDLCKDAGQTAVASAVEICGAVCAIFAALPLLKTFLRMIGELV
jgi:stage III sporulation protein AD